MIVTIGSTQLKASMVGGDVCNSPRTPGGREIAHYRIYLKDSDEQIVSHTSVECASDHAACMVAESLIKAGVQAEVWDRVRRVWPTGLSIASDRYRFIN